MGGLCSKSAKGEKVLVAKSRGQYDNHKSGGKNYKPTMVSDLTTAGEGMEEKKQKQEHDAAGTRPDDDFYDGIPRYNDSFPHKSRSVKSSKAAAAKVG